MGTVGLSFGSPTGGAGFDVGATVSSIVANLQNVETPWKSQLTSLEAQDTSISTLGTLLSNLSNDVSSLTSFDGVLAQKTGSSSNTDVLTLTAADLTAVAGTHTVEVTNLAQTSSGYLAQIGKADDTLSGSITLGVGGGKTQTITLGPSNDTLAGLAAAINSSSAGISASVLTDSSGSRLSLVSGTSGAAGDIAVSANSIVDTSNTTTITPAYTSLPPSSGTTSTSGTLAPIANAAGDTLAGSISFTVAGGTAQTVTLGSSDNTLASMTAAINAANLGVTAAVVTNSDGSSSLSLNAGTSSLAVTSSVVDTTSSLAYVSPIAGEDANLTVDGVALTSASNTVSGLIQGVTFQLLAPTNGGSQVQVVIGNDNSGVESTVNQFVTDYNSLISAMSTQEGNTSSGTPEPLFGSPTLSLLQQQLLGGLNVANPNGSLTSIAANAGTTLSGSISISVGSGTAQPFTLDSSDNTLAGLASAINAQAIGVTAAVVTTGGQSSLSLQSQLAGSSGALTVSSSILATTPTALTYFDSGALSGTTADVGTLTSIANAGDALSGSISIQVGTGTAHTVSLPASPGNTLAGLAAAINSAGLGATASVVTANGTSSLQLTSGTVGSAGALTVTSSVLDTAESTSATLAYSNNSDIGSLTGLGISVNNNGSVTYDATSLDSLLNTDYSGVAGFFQGTTGWGQSFSTMLTNAGTTAGTGELALASSSNSSIESTLNANISKEQAVISAEQVSLTNELNSANEILQELPSQLQGVNELYSAITGYNQQSNG
jgi:flagellar hook-associated protein 2